MTFKSRTEQLHVYFFLSYLAVVLLCLGYLDPAVPADPWTVVFCLATLTSYSVVYLLPAFLITMTANRLSACWADRRKLSSLNTFSVAVPAVLTTSVTLIALYADRQIYHLFGFHFNSFVINLITTPGGIDSMGGSDDANMVYILISAAFIVMEIAFFIVSGYLQRRWANK